MPPEEQLPSHSLQPYQSAQLQSWDEGGFPSPAQGPVESPFERPLAAVRRYKWLELAVVVLATVGGVAATRFIEAQYEVQARIMIAAGGPMQDPDGPIRAAGLLQADDWSALLKSGTIADAVARQLTLYLQPADGSTRPLFAGFALSDFFRAGKYELLIDRDTQRWTLSAKPTGEAIDTGAATDSIGKKIGFLWALPRSAMGGTGQQRVRFTVLTPRETAVQLTGRLSTVRQYQSNFLTLSLQDKNPQLAAKILNTWAREFVTVAAQLKKTKLTEFRLTLEDQLHTARKTLDSADILLSSYKVNTITQPAIGGPIAAGVQETRDPVYNDYFARKIELSDLQRDIQLLRGVVQNTDSSSVPTEALLQIRTVATSPAAQTLRNALTEYQLAITRLDTLRNIYTEQHTLVKTQLALVTSLRTQKIPQYTSQLLRSLEMRSRDDSARIASASTNLQQIPERNIEEDRLRRNRDVMAGIYANLQNRLSAAQLAEASETPDLRILDTAIAPIAPTRNTAPRVILMAVVGGIGAALALALLLDRMDGRFRYPEQATGELGLAIAGTVPRFPKGGVNQNSPEQMFQLVESFRSLRMTVVSSVGDGPVTVAVSSPAPSDGKSLISANLAMSFADAGFRTVLVDGDTRRGVLHETFSTTGKPGLTDYLAGVASFQEMIRQSGHELLHVVPSGTRRRRSPELLASPKLPELVNRLRQSYDVVVFDTPPLAAGIDGYSIAAATGNLLIVLRVGKTLRRMAAEKLRLFTGLPVNLIGAVLNGIAPEGAYAYYGYVPGYAAEEESDRTDVVRQ